MKLPHGQWRHPGAIETLPAAWGTAPDRDVSRSLALAPGIDILTELLQRTVRGRAHPFRFRRNPHRELQPESLH